MKELVQLVGHTGFIGRHLFRALSNSGVSVFGISRLARASVNLNGCKILHEDSFTKAAEGQVAVATDAKVVVFAAGLAHLQHPSSAEFKEYMVKNCELPVEYARAAIAVGVKRFIYLSSIGVCGEGSLEAYSERSGFSPSDEYSRSKVAAERELTKLFRDTDSELVIIRPPMVYGPNAPGNFSRLASLVRKGLPLPFGGLSNPRSFISIQNLVSFLVCCIDHPNAGGQVFVVSDNDDTTTCNFVREIADAQGRSVKLLPVPRWLFVTGLTLLGQGKAARKLSAPLTVDCSHAMRTLDWRPPYSLREGVRLSFEDTR